LLALQAAERTAFTVGAAGAHGVARDRGPTGVHGVVAGHVRPGLVAPRGRKARAISVVLAGPILAGAVGLPLGTALSEPLGWRAVVGTVAVAMTAGAVALPRLLPAAPTAVAPPVSGERDESARRVPVREALRRIRHGRHSRARVGGRTD